MNLIKPFFLLPLHKGVYPAHLDVVTLRQNSLMLLVALALYKIEKNYVSGICLHLCLFNL